MAFLTCTHACASRLVPRVLPSDRRSHRLSQVLAGILTAQQIEKLGVWWTEHEGIVLPPGIPVSPGGATHSHSGTPRAARASRAPTHAPMQASGRKRRASPTPLPASVMTPSAAGMVWPAAVGAGMQVPYAATSGADAGYMNAAATAAHVPMHHAPGAGGGGVHAGAPGHMQHAGGSAMPFGWAGVGGGSSPTGVERLRLQLHQSSQELRTLEQQIQQQQQHMGGDSSFDLHAAMRSAAAPAVHAGNAAARVDAAGGTGSHMAVAAASHGHVPQKRQRRQQALA